MSGNGFGKEDISRTAIPARPYAKDMATINRLMARLQTISDDKAKGKITFQQANKKAVEAIHKARNTKSKSLQRKPLDYLERICEIRVQFGKLCERFPNCTRISTIQICGFVKASDVFQRADMLHGFSHNIVGVELDRAGALRSTVDRKNESDA